jgi:hypothetical protein
MRHSKFGEAYCHTAAEAQALIDEAEDDVYLPSFPPDPPEGDFGASIEIAESGSGDNVCFVEAPTVEGVIRILGELGLMRDHQ